MITSPSAHRGGLAEVTNDLVTGRVPLSDSVVVHDAPGVVDQRRAPCDGVGHSTGVLVVAAGKRMHRPQGGRPAACTFTIADPPGSITYDVRT